jgi:hypothetical protein
MKRLAIQIVSVAVGWMVVGTAEAAYFSEAIDFAGVVPSNEAVSDLSSQFFQADANIGFSTQFELSLIEVPQLAVTNLERNTYSTPFGPAGPSPLPEFPTILAGLLLLVPLGMSTIRILMNRPAA